MAIMATESTTSSKKPAAPKSHDERDAKRTQPGEVGKGSGDKAPRTPPHPPPNAEPEDLDDELDDPYDNVACTD
jgi:hypothetical protein